MEDNESTLSIIYGESKEIDELPVYARDQYPYINFPDDDREAQSGKNLVNLILSQ
jgi:hypothetical protein